MADKRRINGPPGGTRPPVFASSLQPAEKPKSTTFERPARSRKPDELRKTFLKTGLIPSASGSAYLELQPSAYVSSFKSKSLIPPTSSLKLTCSVHGPKPLPRSTPFSPNLVLSTHVKYAPFAARRRRGHVRDMSERDLGVHLENALRGAIIGDRWPKSGLDVTITILEGEDDRWWGDTLTVEPLSGADSWGLMNVLASCITVASAAIADAGVDCLDLIAGGVAAYVEEKAGQKDDSADKTQKQQQQQQQHSLVLDPDPSEHRSISAACVIGYLPSRDEITELWLKGDVPNTHSTELNGPPNHERLIDGAVGAAKAMQRVVMEAVIESVQRAAGESGHNTSSSNDEMEI